MIKDTDEVTNSGFLWQIYCDKCHKVIFECIKGRWITDKLMYSPILCEEHGREMNKWLGETAQENTRLKKHLKKYKEKFGELIIKEESNIGHE